MSRPSSLYTPAFYERVSAGALASARALVPLVLEYIQPESLVDVGCGAGAWLSTFKSLGTETVLGIDGSHVDPKSLLFDPTFFRAADLTQALHLDQEYDLVVCLEVAEHIPPECAEQLIASLTRLGSVVLFSAAVPFQGGTGHINEQWQGHWARLFANHDFMPVDCLRNRVWDNPNIGFEYAQNTLIYSNCHGLDRWPGLREARSAAASSPLSAIHPRLFLRYADPDHLQIKRSVARVLTGLWRRIRVRLPLRHG